MKDFLLGADHDLVIKDFDFQFTTKEQFLPQKIKQTLLAFQGEWFLDLEDGIPYFKDVLGQKSALDSVRSVFIDAINNVEQVKSLLDFNMDYDNTNRTLKLKFTVTDYEDNFYEIGADV